jgi:hypothetical protein
VEYRLCSAECDSTSCYFCKTCYQTCDFYMSTGPKPKVVLCISFRAIFTNIFRGKTQIWYIRRVWRYQRGNQNLLIEEWQTRQWQKEKVQKDKQRSTKHTYRTKDWVTRTPPKTGGGGRCSSYMEAGAPVICFDSPFPSRNNKSGIPNPYSQNRSCNN